MVNGHCILDKKNVKCTLVQALRLCTDRTAYRGSRGVALLLLDHGIIKGWGVSVTPRPLFTPGKEPVPIVQEAGWAPGPVWTGAEISPPTGIRSPDRPARSQSLYRLSYPAHVCWNPKAKNTRSECVMLTVFHCNNDCTNAPQCYVIHTYPVLLGIAIASDR